MGIPNCRGYESSSGGFEKSAAFAMLRPHLNVGAQKWTEIISGFTTHQTLLLTRKYYAKIQPIQLFGFTEETLQPQIPKNKFLNRIKIFRFCPWKWNQKPLHRNQTTLNMNSNNIKEVPCLIDKKTWEKKSSDETAEGWFA